MPGIRWPDLVELGLLWAGVYLVLRSLRGTRGLGILKGTVGVVAFLYVLGRAMALFGFPLARITFLIENLVTVGLLGFVILFQPELRRALTRLGEQPWAWLSGERAMVSISPIVEAASRMSRRRIGALIVIERRQPLGSIVETGVPLDAEVSAPLLESIFYPNGPLHDGAVVVRGDRIIAASCLLPLSDAPDLSQELGREAGTRHRAALGMAEDSDAVVVVVSEQTGRISLAHDGRLEPLRDARDLERRLAELLQQSAEASEAQEEASEAAAAEAKERAGETEAALDRRTDGRRAASPSGGAAAPTGEAT